MTFAIKISNKLDFLLLQKQLNKFNITLNDKQLSSKHYIKNVYYIIDTKNKTVVRKSKCPNIPVYNK